MAIRVKHDPGPQPMPEMKDVLAGRKFTIDADSAMCPHCYKPQPNVRGKRGIRKCKDCSNTFWWEKRGPWSYLTSKTEIPSGEIQE